VVQARHSKSGSLAYYMNNDGREAYEWGPVAGSRMAKPLKTPCKTLPHRITIKLISRPT